MRRVRASDHPDGRQLPASDESRIQESGAEPSLADELAEIVVRLDLWNEERKRLELSQQAAFRRLLPTYSKGTRADFLRARDRFRRLTDARRAHEGLPPMRWE